MSGYIISNTLRSLGPQIGNRHVNGPVVAGCTILPVAAPDLRAALNRTSGRVATGDEVQTTLVKEVEEAAVAVETELTRLTEEHRALKAAINKDGRAAAERADTATLDGIAAEIRDALRPRQRAAAEREADALAEVIARGYRIDFDLGPINAALERLRTARHRVQAKADDLRGLQAQIDQLMKQATDPAVLAKLTGDAKAAAARSILPGLVDELRDLSELNASITARLGHLLRVMEAAR